MLDFGNVIKNIKLIVHDNMFMAELGLICTEEQRISTNFNFSMNN